MQRLAAYSPVTIGKLKRRAFTVLAFESSADDTAVAIIRDTQVLSNVVIKQHRQNEIFGGIHPQTAIQWHQKNMPIAVKKALDEASISASMIDGVAFTRGPGMGGCLSVSVNAAKTLAAALGKPIVGVHHLQAHALTPLFTSSVKIGFPFLTLLVSGGHTMILLAQSTSSFRLLSNSVDIAIGNAYDKVARMLNIRPDSDKGYGAALETFCQQSQSLRDESGLHGQYPFPPLKYNLPNPQQANLISFTGLVAAVQRAVELDPVDDSTRLKIAQAFQDAAVSQLELKLKGAFRWCEGNGMQEACQTLIVSGGVASNRYLRNRLERFLQSNQGSQSRAIFPPPELCTDNAVMVGWASLFRFLGKDFDDYGVLPQSKWDIESLKGNDDSYDHSKEFEIMKRLLH